MKRRSLLKVAALSMSTSFASPNRKPHVAVIGAGAFGGWTALHLLRSGAKVTLLDTWGPGNSRASSGGETRIIRAAYGPKRQYVNMAARALQLWKENEKRWNCRLFHRTGMLWMAGASDELERASLPLLREAGVAFDELSAAQAAKRFPQINFENVKWAIFEKESGFLTARRNCQTVLEHFLAEGGEYRETSVTPGALQGREMTAGRAVRRKPPFRRSLRFRLRSVARHSFSRRRWRSDSSHAPGNFLLWRACRRSALFGKSDANLDRPRPGTPVLRRPRQRVARFQGRRRHARREVRSDKQRAHADSRSRSATCASTSSFASRD